MDWMDYALMLGKHKLEKIWGLEDWAKAYDS